ncbi:MAG TPA: cytochrome c peroxidase [Bacteroidia bacterium]
MKKLKVVVLLCVMIFLLDSFTRDNPFLHITKKDVELNVPKTFPNPVYDFKTNKLSPEAFTLGRKLFYDPILSRDSSTSCSSCHMRIAAFAHIDHPLSHGINGLIGKRNVPALQNLIWKDALMDDGGVNNLEVQPLAPLTNKVEMDETLAHVLVKLRRNPEYVTLFKSAFKDTAITSERMLKALAQFTGLMISSDSRYDRYVQKKDTFSHSEMNGLKLFRERCTNCHKEPLFTDNSYRNIGLAPDTSLNDPGRSLVTGLNDDKMKFKVPSLRNVEMTYPYMHDGRFKKLEQVMEFYSKGNFHGDYDKSLDKTKTLSKQEMLDLIAFLKTLTDKTFLYDKRFADPNYK